NIQKAILSKGQSEKQIEGKLLSIGEEISGLVEQLELSRSIIVLYETKQLKAARDVRDAQQKQFGTGHSAVIGFLCAVTAYTNVVSSYYETVAEYRRNLARLNASLGKDI